MTGQRLTDEDYRARYVARLAALLVEREGCSEREAGEIAAADYQRMPRGCVADALVEQPETAADESYVELWADVRTDVECGDEPDDLAQRHGQPEPWCDDYGGDDDCR